MIRTAIILLISQFFVAQGKIDVILKDIDCPFYHKDYFTEPDTYIDDNNEVFLNYSIIKALPPTIEAYFAIIGASMGEYVVDTGLDFRMPLCDMIDERFVMGPALQVLGVSEDNCPPQPGIYGSDGYAVPDSLFPDNFPPNQYVEIFKFIHEDKDILISRVYFDVQ